MSSPWLLEAPSLISFSAGRTSGFQLHQALDADGGSLPDGLGVTFSNTGKEHPATVDFVQACSERWNVPMSWLEYDPEGEKGRKFRNVDHPTVSRNGEPYEALLRKRDYLPNPVTRFPFNIRSCPT